MENEPNRSVDGMRPSRSVDGMVRLPKTDSEPSKSRQPLPVPKSQTELLKRQLVTSAPPPAKPPKKRRRIWRKILWGLISLILLAAASGAIWYIYVHYYA